MNKFQSDLKAKLHMAIIKAGYDGMEYIHDDITEAEYRIRQQLLEDELFAFITTKELPE